MNDFVGVNIEIHLLLYVADVFSNRQLKWSVAWTHPFPLLPTPTLGKSTSGSKRRKSLTRFFFLFRFGGPANVARTVTQYVRAGVAGLHIEDQVQTKRCGHLMGKQVVSREEFLTRIRAAVIARDSIPGGSDFVIIGRTDSAQVLGMEEAVTRLKLAADAGADVCFIEGVKTEELLRSTVAALAPKPVLVNVISGGLTPSFTCAEAERMGAKIISMFILTAICQLVL